MPVSSVATFAGRLAVPDKYGECLVGGVPPLGGARIHRCERDRGEGDGVKGSRHGRHRDGGGGGGQVSHDGGHGQLRGSIRHRRLAAGWVAADSYGPADFRRSVPSRRGP